MDSKYFERSTAPKLASGRSAGAGALLGLSGEHSELLIVSRIHTTCQAGFLTVVNLTEWTLGRDRANICTQYRAYSAGSCNVDFGVLTEQRYVLW